MCDQQFDVSEKLKKLFEIKQKQRNEAKIYYQKLLYNPHRVNKSEIPFDTQLQRFSAMSAYHSRYFQPNAKYYSGLFLYLSPFVLFFYMMRNSKKKEEELLRSGVVKYSDRSFRHIY